MQVQQAGSNWAEAMKSLSLAEAVEVICHFLSSLKQPLLTIELCRWFQDTDAVQDAKFRLRLLCSLIHCLPKPNRVGLSLLVAALPRSGDVAVMQPLFPALLGLPLGAGSNGQGIFTSLLSEGAWDLIFSQSQPNYRMAEEPAVDSAGGPSERLGVVLATLASDALDLLCDPYYTAIIEESFPDMLAHMHSYVWKEEADALLAVNLQLRRFLRPVPWMLECRLKLLCFVKSLVQSAAQAVFSQATWGQRWSELMVLISFDLANKMPQDSPSALPATARWLLGFQPVVGPANGGVTILAGTTSLNVLEHSPELVASALQRFFLGPFSALSWCHLVRQRWLDAAASPPFAQLVSCFNGLHAWGVLWVLEADQERQRATRVAFLLKCAHYCRKQLNFHAAFALFFACSDPAVARLSRSWKAVPSKALSYFAELRALGDSKNNHSTYANALREAAASPPVIPYMALVSKYLFTFEEANPTYVDGTKDVLNWVKLRMIYSFISSVFSLRTAQQPKSEASSSNETQLVAFFNLVCASKVDNSVTYARSLELEPREETN
jgi:hypothetical protein